MSRAAWRRIDKPHRGHAPCDGGAAKRQTGFNFSGLFHRSPDCGRALVAEINLIIAHPINLYRFHPVFDFNRRVATPAGRKLRTREASHTGDLIITGLTYIETQFKVWYRNFHGFNSIWKCEVSEGFFVCRAAATCTIVGRMESLRLCQKFARH